MLCLTGWTHPEGVLLRLDALMEALHLLGDHPLQLSHLLLSPAQSHLLKRVTHTHTSLASKSTILRAWRQEFRSRGLLALQMEGMRVWERHASGS